MEFPFGHHHHHNHHHRRDDDDDEDSNTNRFPPHQPAFPPHHQPPSFGGAYPHAPPDSYPPPAFGSGAYPPPSSAYPPPPDSYAPPPGAGVISHSHHESPYAPPQSAYAPPPAAGVISHSHHEGGGSGHHSFQPHMPGFIAGHFHHSQSGTHHGDHHDGAAYGTHDDHDDDDDDAPLRRYFAKKPTFKLYCKAGGDRYAVAIRDGKVILVQHNPDDPNQHWYKDEKFSTKVKDSDGYPSFALVNKATGQAIKHSISGHPVNLVPYNPDELDPSILWTESKDLGHGFRTIRMVNNVKLVMDAFHGDKDHGGVHDGTIVALYESWKGDNQNQQWRLSHY